MSSLIPRCPSWSRPGGDGETSSQYLYFWLCSGQITKYLMVMTSLLWNSFFWSSNVERKNNDILGILRKKNGQDRYVFKRKFKLSKFDLFWPKLGLTLGEISKWVSPLNAMCQMTHKTCVARHLCYIFIWWHHLTWPWPRPVLCISLLFTWHLRHPFSSIF